MTRTSPRHRMSIQPYILTVTCHWLIELIFSQRIIVIQMLFHMVVFPVIFFTVVNNRCGDRTDCSWIRPGCIALLARVISLL